MFGWEFPPHNSGGLGTACFGLTRALANRNIEVLFVLPKKVGVSASFMNILFADERRVKFHEIETTLKPYVTSEGYIRERDKIFSDVYGNTLMQEVRRYALRARDIAKKEKFPNYEKKSTVGICFIGKVNLKKFLQKKIKSKKAYATSANIKNLTPKKFH